MTTMNLSDSADLSVRIDEVLFVVITKLVKGSSGAVRSFLFNCRLAVEAVLHLMLLSILCSHQYMLKRRHKW